MAHTVPPPAVPARRRFPSRHPPAAVGGFYPPNPEAACTRFGNSPRNTPGQDTACSFRSRPPPVCVRSELEQFSLPVEALIDFTSPEAHIRNPQNGGSPLSFLIRAAALGLVSGSLFLPIHCFADTLLAGTSLANTSEGPVLCPEASNCNARASQFTTPVQFTMTDVQLVLSGPASATSPVSSANYEVYLLSGLDQTETEQGPAYTAAGTELGSGTVNFSGSPTEPAGDVSELIDLNNLDILLEPGQEYYIEVLGGNLMWNTGALLTSTPGSLGAQISCDPDENCGSSDMDAYGQMDRTYALQISGNPAITPEPGTWWLLVTGVAAFSAIQLRQRFVGKKLFRTRKSL